MPQVMKTYSKISQLLLGYLIILCWIFFWEGVEFEGSGSVQWVESCTVVFLVVHFLFTCLDTFAVGCIV